MTRLLLAGRTVIRKEPLGPDAVRGSRHEVAMLERLRGVVGVAQLVESPRYPGSIVMADAGGRSLAGVARPLAVEVRLAVLVPRSAPSNGAERPARRRRHSWAGTRTPDLTIMSRAL